MVDRANHDRAAARRRGQGRRPPGQLGVDGGHHDVAVVRPPERRRQGGGQAARLARVPRHQVPDRRARPLLPHPAARARRPAGLPVADEGPGRGRLLDRLGRARRRGAPVRGHGPALRRRPLRRRAPGPLHRPRRRRRARRGQRLGGHRRPGAPGPRQRHVDHRRQPPEPRPRHPGHEGPQADEVLRRLRAGTSSRPSTAAGCRRRSPGPAASTLRRHIDEMSNEEYQSLFAFHGRRAARAVPGRRRRGA